VFSISVVSLAVASCWFSLEHEEQETEAIAVIAMIIEQKIIRFISLSFREDKFTQF